MAKTDNTLRLIDGVSESLWKSLIVKSLRIGWPEGLRQASERVSRSTMKSLLVCGLFEDTFPPSDQLDECLAEIERGDYDALCARETHHGRGYADAFCDLKDEALAARESERWRLADEARRRNFYLPPRAGNCFYTWLALAPQHPKSRSLDDRAWEGMPVVMADSHTYEGKRKGIYATVLSGHYANHRALGERVIIEGWSNIRDESHKANIPAFAEQNRLL